MFGGIPYYLGYIDNSRSLAQNVDKLFFARNGILKNEYNRLFDSVFANPEAIKAIVELLYTRNAGYTRKEITEKLAITDGGTLSKNLNALLASDFVVKYAPFGFSKRDEHYKQIDLLIHRNDNVINMCKIKFLSEDFKVDNSYYRVLLSRPERIREMVSPKISVYSTLITTFGLQKCAEYATIDCAQCN